MHSLGRDLVAGGAVGWNRMADMFIEVDGERYPVQVVFSTAELEFDLTASVAYWQVTASGPDLTVAMKRLVDAIRDYVYRHQRGGR